MIYSNFDLVMASTESCKQNVRQSRSVVPRINLHLTNRGAEVYGGSQTIASPRDASETHNSKITVSFASHARINSRPRKLVRSLIISRDTLRHFARCQKFAFGCFAVA